MLCIVHVAHSVYILILLLGWGGGKRGAGMLSHYGSSVTKCFATACRSKRMGWNGLPFEALPSGMSAADMTKLLMTRFASLC